MASALDPKVCVVIPTWTRSGLLEECLRALRHQTFTDFRTILVLNGAGGRATELAREYGCATVSFPKNRGFAAAINAGVAAAGSPYVMLLNDDVELDSDWLRQAATLLDERPDLSFCCGKLVHSGGTDLDNAGDALSMAGSAWRLGYGRPDSAQFDFPKPLFAVSATAALFRRAVFQQLGGLDEEFFSYLEDMDFSLRARRAGLQGMYWPQAVARHHGGATLGGTDSAAVFELVTRNQVLLLAKHYPLSFFVRLSPRIVWAQWLRALMAVKKGMAAAYWRGIAGALRQLPKAIRKRDRWTREESQKFWAWLRDSEAAIYEDIRGQEPLHQNRFWRLYFWICGARSVAAAPKTTLDHLPGSETPR